MSLVVGFFRWVYSSVYSRGEEKKTTNPNILSLHSQPLILNIINEKQKQKYLWIETSNKRTIYLFIFWKACAILIIIECGTMWYNNGLAKSPRIKYLLMGTYMKRINYLFGWFGILLFSFYTHCSGVLNIFKRIFASRYYFFLQFPSIGLSMRMVQRHVSIRSDLQTSEPVHFWQSQPNRRTFLLKNRT